VKATAVAAASATPRAIASLRIHGRRIRVGPEAKMSKAGATAMSPPRSPTHQIRHAEAICESGRSLAAHRLVTPTVALITVLSIPAYTTRATTSLAEDRQPERVPRLNTHPPREARAMPRAAQRASPIGFASENRVSLVPHRPPGRPT
jgi:hypothetical protein